MTAGIPPHEPREKWEVDWPTHDGLVVLKSTEAIEQYRQMFAELHPRRMVELGIYNGGSAVLLAEMAQPERFAVVDIIDSCPTLDGYLGEHDLPVVPYYGVDQADGAELDRVMAGFDGPVDLIIDDASHLEPQTRASFNRLFPHLREGGLYVIEDWGWAHIASAFDQERTTSPSAFVFELVAVAARLPRMIPEVTVSEYTATIRRGTADLRPERFDISSCLDPMGREMVDRLRSV